MSQLVGLMLLLVMLAVCIVSFQTPRDGDDPSVDLCTPVPFVTHLSNSTICCDGFYKVRTRGSRSQRNLRKGAQRTSSALRGAATYRSLSCSLGLVRGRPRRMCSQREEWRVAAVG